MYKILQISNKNFGTLFAQLDSNFLSVINAMIKIASPNLTLKGYADANNEPDSPAENDCYLVVDDGTIWSLSVVKNDIISWNGTAWVKESFSLTELNTVFQALFFDAENISINPIHGMAATNVQSALEELAELHFGAAPGSGSGSV